MSERGFCTSFLNDLFEELTVLTTVDGFKGSADQLDVVLLSTPASPNAMAAFSAVWPPKVGSSAGTFLGDDLLENRRGNRSI